MPKVEKSVFISYRRSTSEYLARAIYLDLRASGYDVFLDFESIDSGSFERIILGQIAARAHFLALLTPGSVERCVNSDDWMRREIEYAMDMGRNVVPVSAQGFSFEDAEPYLKGRLVTLPQYNALVMPSGYFDEAMTRLRTRFLNKPLELILHPTLPEDRAAVEEAITESAAAPEPTPDQLQAEQHFERGMTLANQSDYARAIKAFTQAITLKPDFVQAYYQRGRAYANESLADFTAMGHALDDWQEAIQLAPEDRKINIIQSCIFREQGDFDRAVAEANEGVRRNPEDYDAYFQRGNALRRQDRLAEAIADYDAAIRLNSREAAAYNNRGLARFDQGDYERAIADHSGAIRLNPGFAPGYYNRGLVRHNQEDLEGAIADYETAIHLNPRYAVAYNNRGNIRYKQGDLEGAIADYETALRLAPELGIARQNLDVARNKLRAQND